MRPILNKTLTYTPSTRHLELACPKWPYFIYYGSEDFRFIRRDIKFTPEKDCFGPESILYLMPTLKQIETTRPTATTFLPFQQAKKQKQSQLVTFRKLPQKKKQMCPKHISILAKPRKNNMEIRRRETEEAKRIYTVSKSALKAIPNSRIVALAKHKQDTYSETRKQSTRMTKVLEEEKEKARQICQGGKNKGRSRKLLDNLMFFDQQITEFLEERETKQISSFPEKPQKDTKDIADVMLDRKKKDTRSISSKLSHRKQIEISLSKKSALNKDWKLETTGLMKKETQMHQITPIQSLDTSLQISKHQLKTTISKQKYDAEVPCEISTGKSEVVVGSRKKSVEMHPDISKWTGKTKVNVAKSTKGKREMKQITTKKEINGIKEIETSMATKHPKETISDNSVTSNSSISSSLSLISQSMDVLDELMDIDDESLNGKITLTELAQQLSSDAISHPWILETGSKRLLSLPGKQPDITEINHEEIYEKKKQMAYGTKSENGVKLEMKLGDDETETSIQTKDVGSDELKDRHKTNKKIISDQTREKYEKTEEKKKQLVIGYKIDDRTSILEHTKVKESMELVDRKRIEKDTLPDTILKGSIMSDMAKETKQEENEQNKIVEDNLRTENGTTDVKTQINKIMQDSDKNILKEVRLEKTRFDEAKEQIAAQSASIRDTETLKISIVQDKPFEEQCIMQDPSYITDINGVGVLDDTNKIKENKELETTANEVYKAKFENKEQRNQVTGLELPKQTYVSTSQFEERTLEKTAADHEATNVLDHKGLRVKKSPIAEHSKGDKTETEKIPNVQKHSKLKSITGQDSELPSIAKALTEILPVQQLVIPTVPIQSQQMIRNKRTQEKTKKLTKKPKSDKRFEEKEQYDSSSTMSEQEDLNEAFKNRRAENQVTAKTLFQDSELLPITETSIEILPVQQLAVPSTVTQTQQIIQNEQRKATKLTKKPKSYEKDKGKEQSDSVNTTSERYLHEAENNRRAEEKALDQMAAFSTTAKTLCEHSYETAEAAAIETDNAQMVKCKVKESLKIDRNITKKDKIETVLSPTVLKELDKEEITDENLGTESTICSSTTRQTSAIIIPMGGNTEEKQQTEETSENIETLTTEHYGRKLSYITHPPPRKVPPASKFLISVASEESETFV